MTPRLKENVYGYKFQFVFVSRVLITISNYYKLLQLNLPLKLLKMVLKSKLDSLSG